MAKAKSEHYVNNKELLEALKVFLEKVDSSYERYHERPITWSSDKFLESVSFEKWSTTNSKDRVEYQKWLDYESFKLIKEERSKRWKGKPVITRYIGSCFLKIATHLSYKPNFVNYMFREDMISDGIENCVQYIFNFNSDKSNNPFAYFTQIIHYAFLRRIQREKRQLDIKNKIVEKTGFEALMTSDSNLTSEYRNDYNAIKENIITKLNS